MHLIQYLKENTTILVDLLRDFSIHLAIIFWLSSIIGSTSCISVMSRQTYAQTAQITTISKMICHFPYSSITLGDVWGA
jgi:hypothetical protein